MSSPEIQVASHVVTTADTAFGTLAAWWPRVDVYVDPGGDPNAQGSIWEVYAVSGVQETLIGAAAFEGSDNVTPIRVLSGIVGAGESIRLKARTLGPETVALTAAIVGYDPAGAPTSPAPTTEAVAANIAAPLTAVFATVAALVAWHPETSLLVNAGGAAGALDIDWRVCASVAGMPSPIPLKGAKLTSALETLFQGSFGGGSHFLVQARTLASGATVGVSVAIVGNGPAASSGGGGDTIWQETATDTASFISPIHASATVGSTGWHVQPDGSAAFAGGITSGAGAFSVAGEADGIGSFACAGGLAIGQDSFAGGQYAEADGINSFAWGGSNAQGDTAVAMGASTAVGDHSAAFAGSRAQGDYSFSANTGSTSPGYASFSCCEGTATGDYSFAQSGTSDGINAFAAAGGSASGNSSFATSSGTASGLASIALNGLAVGDFSFAAAGGAANGISSIALGVGAVAGQYGSVATSGGYATGENAFAHGIGATANGYESVAMGSASVYQDRACGFGQGSTADGYNSFACSGGTTSNDGAFAGAYGHASGLASFAYGDGTEASGNWSVAFGHSTTAAGVSSFATGYLSQALGDYSVAMGPGAVAGGIESVAIGSCNTGADYSSKFGTDGAALLALNADGLGTAELDCGVGGALAFGNVPTQSSASGAGGASLLPATPAIYLKLMINGNPYVFPGYPA